MSWTDQPIHFVDFEGSRAGGIVEYGVATVHHGRIIRALTRLCAPIGRIRPEDTAVHGLSEADLRAERPFSDEWETFASFREHGPMAAHYAGVENGLLKSVWPYPRRSPDFARPGGHVIDWGPWIDTARLYAQLYPNLGSGKLESLVVAAGLQAELEEAASVHCPATRRHYHAALYDALSGALLLAALARDPQIRDFTVMQLLALSTLDGERRDALQQGELF